MTIYEQIMAGELPWPHCAKTLGFEVLHYCPEAMTLHVGFDGAVAFTNPAGHIQGGFLCAMLDDVMGPALVFSLEEGQFAPTLELKTQFIRPAKPGRIEGKGKVVSKGKHICFMEGALFQHDTLIAKATATAMITR